jgi:hypothetical protein
MYIIDITFFKADMEITGIKAITDITDTTVITGIVSTEAIRYSILSGTLPLPYKYDSRREHNGPVSIIISEAIMDITVVKASEASLIF